MVPTELCSNIMCSTGVMRSEFELKVGGVPSFRLSECQTQRHAVDAYEGTVLGKSGWMSEIVYSIVCAGLMEPVDPTQLFITGVQ